MNTSGIQLSQMHLLRKLHQSKVIRRAIKKVKEGPIFATENHFQCLHM